jgi:hypothetical protein
VAAGAVVLDGVRQEVEQHLHEPLPVGVREGALRPRRLVQGHAVLLGQRPHEAERLAQHRGDGHRLEREVLAPGLDAGDLEHLVDEPQQVAPRLEDVPHRLALRRRQLGARQQLGEAEDRVHRRAQLVAHPAQELALRPVRPLRLLRARSASALARPSAASARTRSVTSRPNARIPSSGRTATSCGPCSRTRVAAVLVPDAERRVVRLARPLDDPREVAHHLRHVVRVHEVRRTRAHHLGRGPAEHPLHRRGDVGDGRGLVDDHHVVARVLDEAPEVHVALAQRPLGLDALGDVATVGHEAAVGRAAHEGVRDVLDPAPPPVLVTQAVLDGERLVGPFEEARDGVHHRRHVVGVHEVRRALSRQLAGV